MANRTVKASVSADCAPGAPAFNIAQARADWSAACARYAEADARYLVLCGKTDNAMPEALGARADDGEILRWLLEKFPGRKSAEAYNVAVKELRQWKQEQYLLWPRNELPDDMRRISDRAEEIIAADDAWHKDTAKYTDKAVSRVRDRQPYTGGACVTRGVASEDGGIQILEL